MKIEKTAVTGFIPAIQGMRNSFNSHDKSDTLFDSYYSGRMPNDIFVFDKILIGPRDMQLAMNLVKGKEPECKFRRMIIVWVDITGPWKWWKEFDTYKVGTTANSDSSMHNICDKPFSLDDFTINKKYWNPGWWNNTVAELNRMRDVYLDAKAIGDMETANGIRDELYNDIPSGFNQKRTLCLNYTVLAAIYKQRKGHRLGEWKEICDWIETLPYSEFITGRIKDDE